MLSFQEPLALGLEGGGQLLAALSGSWTEVWLELVGSPASATSKAAVSPWPQFRKHLLCSQHLSGESGSKAVPVPAVRLYQARDTVQSQLEGPTEALYFTDGETEVQRGGRDSLKATQQVVASIHMSQNLPGPFPPYRGPGSPSLGALAIYPRIWSS